MNIVKIVQVRDVFVFTNTSKTWTYLIRGKTSVPHPMRFEEKDIADCICLFPKRKARTHVMLRDNRGRFVSFRNPNAPYIIADAVGSLQPFPNPVEL